jgi:hypothetical protein
MPFPKPIRGSDDTATAPQTSASQCPKRISGAMLVAWIVAIADSEQSREARGSCPWADPK